MAKKPLPSVFANGGPTHAATSLLWRLQVSQSSQEIIEAVGAWAVTEFGMTKVEREQFLLALGLREKFTPQGAQVYTLFNVEITDALEHAESRTQTLLKCPLCGSTEGYSASDCKNCGALVQR